MDTDLDSWNSGDNKPDIMDNATYHPEDISKEAKNGDFVGDEGDENNLGTPIKNGAEDFNDTSTVDDDLVKLHDEPYEPLDDAEYNDNSFDCD